MLVLNNKFQIFFLMEDHNSYLAKKGQGSVNVIA